MKAKARSAHADEDAAVEGLLAARVAQGLGRTIIDPDVLDKVLVLVRGPEPEQH